MIKHLSLSLARAGALFAGALLLASHASAADASVESGANCMQYTDGAFWGVGHSDTGLENSTGSDINITCPFHRELDTSTAGASVKVSVYNPTAGGVFTCTIESFDSTGAWWDYKYGSTTAAGNQTFSIPTVGSKSGGHYTMSCAIPSGSILYHYKLTEN